MKSVTQTSIRPLKQLIFISRYSILLFLTFLLTTCVEEIGVDLPDASEKLVVDGLISTLPGPYTIKLTTAAKYSTGSEGVNLLIGGAKVSISDDAGNREELVEESGGIYKTSAGGLQGQIGRTYTLQIETAQGKKYQSKPELLKPTTGVENIYYEFVNGSPGIEEGFYVYVDTKDPVDTEEYYRWNWVNYTPEVYCRIDEITGFGNNCCSNCWKISSCNGCVNIASDRLSNGNTISRQLLAIVPYTSTSKYFLYYEQQSLTREAYKFWKSLEEQSKNVGGIFDKPPATVRGNIFNVADEDEIVLGYFGASDIKPAAINVNRTGVQKNPSGEPFIQPPPSGVFPPPCFPCEEGAARTKITPPFWQN